MIYEFGNRTANNFVVHYQSELVSARNSAPKFTFDFQDSLVNISYVALAVDVSFFYSFSVF